MKKQSNGVEISRSLIKIKAMVAKKDQGRGKKLIGRVAGSFGSDPVLEIFAVFGRWFGKTMYFARL